MNVCTFVGRITKDIELRHTANGKAIANFSLAVSKGKEDVVFLDFVAWEKQAETIAEYCKKGRNLAVVAEANMERWESEGQKRSRIVFNVRTFTFCESIKNNDSVSVDKDPALASLTAPNEITNPDEIPF